MPYRGEREAYCHSSGRWTAQSDETVRVVVWVQRVNVSHGTKLKEAGEAWRLWRERRYAEEGSSACSWKGRLELLSSLGVFDSKTYFTHPLDASKIVVGYQIRVERAAARSSGGEIVSLNLEAIDIQELNNPQSSLVVNSSALMLIGVFDQS